VSLKVGLKVIPVKLFEHRVLKRSFQDSGPERQRSDGGT